jgi:hypothetical protein
MTTGLGSLNNLTKHFKKRVLERHGSKISEDDSFKIVDDIVNNRAIFIGKADRPHANIYAVLLGNDMAPVIYDQKTKKLITVIHKPYILRKLKERLILLRRKHEKSKDILGQL